jgi:hypothetical protein
LLTPFDILADRFGGALDRLAGDGQAGEELQLFAPLIEGSFVADRRHHPAHARREFRVLDVEIDIHWKLALVAKLTPVVGAETLGGTHGGQHRLRA